MCINQVYKIFIKTDVLYRFNKSDKIPPKSQNGLDKSDVEIYLELSEKIEKSVPGLYRISNAPGEEPQSA